MLSLSDCPGSSVRSQASLIPVLEERMRAFEVLQQVASRAPVAHEMPQRDATSCPNKLIPQPYTKLFFFKAVGHEPVSAVWELVRWLLTFLFQPLRFPSRHWLVWRTLFLVAEPSAGSGWLKSTHEFLKLKRFGSAFWVHGGVRYRWVANWRPWQHFLKVYIWGMVFSNWAYSCFLFFPWKSKTDVSP